MFRELPKKLGEFLFERFESVRDRTQDALMPGPSLEQSNYLRFDFFFSLFHGKSWGATISVPLTQNCSSMLPSGETSRTAGPSSR